MEYSEKLSIYERAKRIVESKDVEAFISAFDEYMRKQKIISQF